LSRDLAHRLSIEGFPVVRMDESGKGESFEATQAATGTETHLRDLGAAGGALLRRHGVERFVVLGLCWGADIGLECAGRMDAIAGLVMLDGWSPRNGRYYLHRYGPPLLRVHRWPGMVLRRLRRRERSDSDILASIAETSGSRWKDEAGWSSVSALCARRLPTLAVYTGDSDGYYSYRGQLRAALTARRFDTSGVTEVFLKDRKHLYPIAHHREQLVGTVTTWLCNTFPASSRVRIARGGSHDRQAHSH
jgi:pimeloyl-ACP methyl ester carboxylesterase